MDPLIQTLTVLTERLFRPVQPVGAACPACAYPDGVPCPECGLGVEWQEHLAAEWRTVARRVKLTGWAWYAGLAALACLAFGLSPMSPQSNIVFELSLAVIAAGVWLMHVWQAALIIRQPVPLVRGKTLFALATFLAMPSAWAIIQFLSHTQTYRYTASMAIGGLVLVALWTGSACHRIVELRSAKSINDRGPLLFVAALALGFVLIATRQDGLAAVVNFILILALAEFPMRRADRVLKHKNVDQERQNEQPSVV